MTLGTLRDQVIYPDERDEQLRRGVSDAELETILQRVQLSYILEREGGWDAVQDWMDVLSGGEKQRIAVSVYPCLPLPRPSRCAPVSAPLPPPP